MRMTIWAMAMNGGRLADSPAARLAAQTDFSSPSRAC